MASSHQSVLHLPMAQGARLSHPFYAGVMPGVTALSRTIAETGGRGTALETAGACDGQPVRAQ